MRTARFEVWGDIPSKITPTWVDQVGACASLAGLRPPILVYGLGVEWKSRFAGKYRGRWPRPWALVEIALRRAGVIGADDRPDILASVIRPDTTPRAVVTVTYR